MKGVTNEPEDETSWLLAIPAAEATKPFTRVARPMISDRADCGSARLLEDDINQDSKAEYSIEVDMPPKTRPTSKTGRNGTMIQQQVMVYVTQNAIHNLLRPLGK